MTDGVTKDMKLAESMTKELLKFIDKQELCNIANFFSTLTLTGIYGKRINLSPEEMREFFETMMIDYEIAKEESNK